jgi:hypothetical protein
MTDTELFFKILGTFDSAIALAIAVWIIQIGIKRMDSLQTQYNSAMQAVLGQQHEDNKALMGLVRDLCNEDGQQVASPKEVMSKNGGSS